MYFILKIICYNFLNNSFNPNGLFLIEMSGRMVQKIITKYFKNKIHRGKIFRK